MICERPVRRSDAEDEPEMGNAERGTGQRVYALYMYVDSTLTDTIPVLKLDLAARWGGRPRRGLARPPRAGLRLAPEHWEHRARLHTVALLPPLHSCTQLLTLS